MSFPNPDISGLSGIYKKNWTVNMKNENIKVINIGGV
jgi:hypothetical protein